MPNKMNSRYQEWNIQFEKQFKLLDLTRSIIFVGWSLGALFLIKWMAELRQSSVLHTTPLKDKYSQGDSFLQLHLVAAPLSEGDFILPKDLSDTVTFCKEIFVYHSLNDNIVPFSSTTKYLKLFNSEKVELFSNPDQGHFLVGKIDSLIKNIKDKVG